MAGTSDDSLVGRVIGGRYRLTKRLAAGGMGVVFRGERVQLGRPVAIKFLHPTFAMRDDALRRFDNEARAMGRLAHPHCVSVMDFGVEDGMPYLVMDFVHGQTLRELLDAGALPLPRALAVFRQILAGVAHAHGQGIIHRDLKPANVMVTEATGTGDHVRILDFGLAKLAGGTSGDTSHSNLAIGTPSYMAPEQARGEAVDARTDVYSLGVLLFELITGEKPFFSDAAFEVLAMHADKPPPRLADKAPQAGASPELEALVARALAKKPEDRFQTAAAFAEALAATPDAQRRTSASDADTQAAPPRAPSAEVAAPTPSAPPPPSPHRGHPGWVVAALLIFGAGAVAAWRFVESQSQAPPPAAASPDAGHARPVPPRRPPVAAPAPVVPPDAPRPDAPRPDAPRPDAPRPDAPPPDAAVPDAPDDDVDATVPPEEQAEPVAEVAPTPIREEEIDTRKPAAPPTPAALEVRTIADAEALIAAGKTTEAIAGLERLREKSPKSAYIPYLLGDLYFERKWWTDGLEAYHAAIRQNRAYRDRAVLVRNAIRALSSAKTVAKARTLLLRDVGAAAAPYLRIAAKSDPNATVRMRASVLLGELAKRR